MADPANALPAARCPICSRPATSKFKPFCSVRCADADLGQWLTGAYRVPGPPADESESESEARPDTRRGHLDPEDGVG